MRTLIFLITLWLMPMYLYAQSPQLPVEVYGKLPSKSLLVLSPDATRLAYRDTADNKDLMVIIDLATHSVVSAIDVSSVKPTNIFFIDNDRVVLTISESQHIWGFTGRHNINKAYTYNLKAKKIHQLLTQGYGIYQGQTQLGNILGVSPDKKYAYMPAYQNGDLLNLYRVDLEKRVKPRLHRLGTSDAIDFFLNENGEVIARERYDNEDDLHRIDAVVDGKWKEIFREKTAIRTKSFNGLTPDRKSLVMIAQNEDRWAYYTMSLADGKISAPIFSHKDKDIERVLTDINRIVYGVQYSGFTPSYEFFDSKLNARINALNNALPESTITINDYTPDWQSMMLYIGGNQSVGDYVLFQNGGLNLITSARPGIPRNAVHPIKAYSFKARDGLTIPSLLTMPKGKEAKNLPAIMLPHGGPESYDKIEFDWLAQYFASQGYAVIQPQFRGSKGFGSAHLLKGRGEWGRKMQDDLTDAVHDLANQGVIDKDRVCIVGGSYGGYAALAGATFTPELYKCVVSINGVSDVERMLHTEERDNGMYHWVVSYWQDLIAKGDVNAEHLEQISPINHIDKVRAPILLIHGKRDKTVLVEQSKNMFSQLKKAKKAATFIELEHGDHHLSNADNRMKALKAIGQFIKQHI